MNLVEFISLMGILDGGLTGLAVGKENGIWGGLLGVVIGLVIGAGSVFALIPCTRMLDQTVFTHPIFQRRFKRKFFELMIAFVGICVQGFVDLLYLILVGCLSGYATYFAGRLRPRPEVALLLVDSFVTHEVLYWFEYTPPFVPRFDPNLRERDLLLSP